MCTRILVILYIGTQYFRAVLLLRLLLRNPLCSSKAGVSPHSEGNDLTLCPDMSEPLEHGLAHGRSSES